MELRYPTEELFPSFHRALDAVAREEVYIEMIEARPLSETAEFQRKIIANNWPAYYVLDGGAVVGWADVVPPGNPRLAHRGFLGMGLLPSHRGRGIGTALLSKTLDHARRIGLEKVELSVYSHNAVAIWLYRKCGFTDVGVIRRYRKLRDRDFDCLEMELFL
jgi:RimJ/RimL family protein N-acetyltransferase